MPKPFIVGVEVEEALFGKVIRKLNSMPGVVKLHLDLDRPGKTGKPAKANGAGKPRGTFTESGDVAILKLLAKGGMRRPELRKAFEEQGRSARSIESPIHALKSVGKIRSDKEGVWSLTAKGKA